MTYELFSERAREVAQRANEEALSFGKESRIDTHHILLGVLKEGAGTAVHALNAHGINVQSVRTEIERLGELGPYQDRRGKLPMTATAKNVVEYALEEARSQGPSVVETEHFILGLLREQEGVAAEIFRFIAVDREAIRREIVNFMGNGAGS